MSETGHNINLTNYSNLITCIGTLNGHYLPVDETIQIAGLQEHYALCKASMKEIKETKLAKQTAINARRILFRPLDTLTRRILASAVSAKATAEQLANMEEIARKIKGERAGTKKAEPVNPDDPKSISVSQQSFANLVDHFDTLIQKLPTVPAYNPNEPDLMVTNLQALHEQMSAANETAFAAERNFSNAMELRNNLMYNQLDCLVNRAASVKSYIFSSSEQGAKNPDYKAVRAIHFRRPRK